MSLKIERQHTIKHQQRFSRWFADLAVRTCLGVLCCALPNNLSAQSVPIVNRGSLPQRTAPEQIAPPPPTNRLPSGGREEHYNEASRPLLPLNQQGQQYDEAPNSFVIPPFGRPSDIEIDVVDGRISLVARGAPLRDVVSLLAEKHGMNLVMAQDAPVPITITLNEVTLMDALEAVVSVAGYTWTTHRGIVHVSSISANNTLTPHVQGRVTRVFELDYVSAIDLDLAIRGMLSPSGTSQVMLNDPRDNRRTKEVIVIEDFPAFVHRIEQYIAAIDILPRQVLIQVHVLEVDLDEQTRHGVNFEALMRIAGADVTLSTVGFANPSASPAFFLEIDGTDLDLLLEALATHTDSETLASPRVLAMNGQESRLQVGERLGYRTNTTTETSTLESINFLDVGVVLNVTPRITRDENVLLHIRPEVSSGEVNETTGLPNETTSEVETNLVLRSGQGVVIGGLIQERDSFDEIKVPWAGDLKLVGSLFRRRTYTTDRSEIIFVLVPHVIPHGCGVEPWQGTGELINCAQKLNQIDFKQPIRCDYEQQVPPVYGPPCQTIVVPTAEASPHPQMQPVQNQQQHAAPNGIWNKIGLKKRPAVQAAPVNRRPVGSQSYGSRNVVRPGRRVMQTSFTGQQNYSGNNLPNRHAVHQQVPSSPRAGGVSFSFSDSGFKSKPQSTKKHLGGRHE